MVVIQSKWNMHSISFPDWEINYLLGISWLPNSEIGNLGWGGSHCALCSLCSRFSACLLCLSSAWRWSFEPSHCGCRVSQAAQYCGSQHDACTHPPTVASPWAPVVIRRCFFGLVLDRFLPTVYVHCVLFYCNGFVICEYPYMFLYLLLAACYFTLWVCKFGK